MNRFKNQLYSTRYKCIVFILLLLVQGSLLAADNLQAFKAKYDVYRHDQHVANTLFYLRYKNDVWTWHMSTSPEGLFKWLTKKIPFIETRMSKTTNGYQLTQIASGDYRDKPAHENTWFDHADRLIYFTDSRKVQNNRLPLPDDVHSYHDIHLLYAKMKQSGQTSMDIHFYKTGTVLESTLTLEPQIEIPYQSGKITVDKMTQTAVDSDKKMIYYYQGHPLAPLKIEQYKDGEAGTMMWRSSVENTSRDKTSNPPG